MPDLQTALSYAATAAAGSCTAVEVWVAEGTYVPDSTGNRNGYFELRNHVALYGGFRGNETSRGDRDYVSYPTILSGDLNGDDVPPFGLNGDNSYNVVYASGVGTTAVLDGFEVRGGNATGGGMDRGAGARFRSGAAPTIRNSIFRHNYASGYTGYRGGGAIFNYNASPTLTNVSFIENRSGCATSYAGGGALYNYGDSHPVLTDVLFLENETTTCPEGSYRGGGAIFNMDPNSEPTLSLTIINGRFVGNSSHTDSSLGYAGGGAIFDNKSSLTMVNVSFEGNRLEGAGRGGAVYSQANPSYDVTNATFVGNSAPGDAAAMLVWGAHSGSMTNLVFAANTGTGAQLSMPGSPSVSVTWSCISDWTSGGTGNINSCRPAFVDADGADDTLGTVDDDVRLSPGSPGVDAGDGSAPGLAGITTDLAGNIRMHGPVDMGAYETAPCGVLGVCPSGFIACVDGATCQNASTNEVWVPAGTFWMGCNATLDSHCSSFFNEKSQHLVTLTQGYAVGRTEVSSADYRAWCETNPTVYNLAGSVVAQGCTPYMKSYYSQQNTYDPAKGKTTHPINYVSWPQARQYCRDLSPGTDLCTEAQWERAARGGCEHASSGAACKNEMHTFPWGSDAPTCDVANMDLLIYPEEFTAPVTSRPAGASPYGALNMNGNVAEYTFDYLGGSYSSAPVTDPVGTDPTSRAVRNGGFTADVRYARSTYRSYITADNDNAATGTRGIRCCRVLTDAGGTCTSDSECASAYCDGAGFCRPASCNDDVQNGDETGLDCGGPCSACPVAQTAVSIERGTILSNYAARLWITSAVWQGSSFSALATLDESRLTDAAQQYAIMLHAGYFDGTQYIAPGDVLSGITPSDIIYSVTLANDTASERDFSTVDKPMLLISSSQRVVFVPVDISGSDVMVSTLNGTVAGNMTGFTIDISIETAN